MLTEFFEHFRRTITIRMPPGRPYWTQDQLALFAKWQKNGYQRKPQPEAMLGSSPGLEEFCITEDLS
jgi:hypothetical protein